MDGPPISARRVRALVKKEFHQIARDPSSILIAVIIPLLLLFIFGYGLSLDSHDLRLGVVLESSDTEARDFGAALTGSDYFVVDTGHDIREFSDRLRDGHLRGIVVIPEDFAVRLTDPGKGPAIQIISDGSEPQLAAFVENYVKGAFRVWLRQRQIESGRVMPPALQIEQRFRYNPSLRSRNFLIPGSIAVIMTVVGALLTALVVAREWERGTMEALLASPVTRAELVIGKFIPYFFLGLGSFTVCLLLAILVFRVPLVGSLPALYAVTCLFLLTALGLGLTISAATKDQFVAAQIALNAAFLPAFILSGFVFEIKSMPMWIQVITFFIPARYFVDSLKTLFLAGDVWSILLPDMLLLSLTTIIFLALTARNMARRLD